MREIILHEVGLRDGLQIEKATVPTAEKLAWIQALDAAGVDMVQVGSFVHQQKVPQMADTDELFEQLANPALPPLRAKLTALVLNEKGLERGFACGVGSFCMGVSASDTHSRKNTGMGTAEAADRIIAMGRQTRAAGAAVQVSVQSAFGCGFEGVIPEARVIDLVRRFHDAGLLQISLADTAGHATPDQVERLFTAVQAIDPAIECACHLHNTYGMGLANAWAALRVGVKFFESAFGGLGGCPFTKITGGNVCTEDLVHMLQRMGYCRGVHLEALIDLARRVGTVLGREMTGALVKTGPIGRAAGTA